MVAPQIKHTEGIQLSGLKRKMSLTQNQTRELWQEFMPLRKKLVGLTALEHYSVEVYPPNYFDQFNPSLEFEKWAAVAPGDQIILPETWETLEIPGGLYAIFLYKGRSSEVHKMYQYILGTWLPNSTYQLDDRPHLGIMGEKYKNNDLESEEELWIPIRTK